MGPLFWLGIVQGLAGGLGGLIGTRAKKKKTEAVERGAKRQNKLINDEINRIQNEVIPEINKFVEDNSYSDAAIEEAVGRIATIFDNAKSETKAAMQLGIESSVKQMQDQYKWSTEDMNAQLADFNRVMEKESKSFRDEWGEGFKKMQDSLAKGRLLRSGFGTTLSKKALKDLNMGEQEIAEKRSTVQKEYGRQLAQLGDKLQSNIRTANMEGASRIQQALAGLSVQQGLTEEQKRQQLENINRQVSQYGMAQGQAQRSNMFGYGLERENINTQADIQRAETPSYLEGFAGGFFGGAGTAAGNIISGAANRPAANLAQGLFGRG